MSVENPNTKKEHKVKQILRKGIEDLEVKQNARLDKIEEFVKTTLTEQENRSKAIHGFVVREVQYNIANKMFNFSVTMDAFVEVMKEAGLPIENFGQKLDDKKIEIANRLQKLAEDQMAERMQQKPAEPVVETVPTLEATSEQA